MNENNNNNPSFEDQTVWELTLSIWKQQGRVFILQVVVVFCSMALSLSQTPAWVLGGMSLLYSMLWNGVLYLLGHPEVKQMKIRYLFDPMFKWKDVKQILNI